MVVFSDDFLKLVLTMNHYKNLLSLFSKGTFSIIIMFGMPMARVWGTPGISTKIQGNLYSPGFDCSRLESMKECQQS